MVAVAAAGTARVGTVAVACGGAGRAAGWAAASDAPQWTQKRVPG
jgi:hypothetical protein